MRAIPTTAALLALMALASAGAHARAATGQWQIDPETIDPFRLSSGEFLDANPDGLLYEARAAYEAADYERAARYYLAALRLNITDAGSIYNLACCFGLLGEERLAALYLLRSFRAGFDDLDWAKGDPDFNAVRESGIFVTLIDSLESARAQFADGLVMTYNEAGAVLPCWIRAPRPPTDAAASRLVVGLHGYGSNPESFSGLYDRLEQPDFVFAAPQAPYAFSLGPGLGYSWGAWSETDSTLWSRAALETEEYVLRVTENLRALFEADEVFLLGFSQGAGFAYDIALRNPEAFDGLICFAGHLDTTWVSPGQIRSASDLRVFVAHGYEDRTIPFESAEEAVAVLEDAGFDVRMFGFTGGHSVPPEALEAAHGWMNGD
ncbi:hypothetical protein JW921_04830 [Candidatus Fermentibacterales bacterium]|nr:hypothetical protein [Candidatus Fermentibacterales bacterium]